MTTLLALLAACPAPATKIPGGRLDVALDGNWTAANGRPVVFPSLQQGTNLLAHHPVRLPANWHPQTRVTLRADATGWLATVAIDGVNAGHDVGGLRPLAIDLTGKLHPGANDLTLTLAPASTTNILADRAVASLSAFTNEMPPPGTVVAGGHLWLEFSGREAIHHIGARLEDADLVATLRASQPAGTRVQFAVVRDGETMATLPDAVLTAGGTATARIPWNSPRWTPADPLLQWLVATVGSEQRAIRFGARALTRTGNTLAVNGENAYLAVLRWPVREPPTRSSLAAFAVEVARIGANGVEFHAEGFSGEAFDTLDELGLYAVVTPVCDGKQRANGPAEPHAPWQEFTAASSQRIADHLGGHPALALWHLEGHQEARDPRVYDAYVATAVPHVDLHDSQGLEATAIPTVLTAAMPAYWNETPWHDPSAAPDLLATVLAAHRTVGLGLALPNLTMSSQPSPAYRASIAALEARIAAQLTAANVPSWPAGPRRGPGGIAVSVRRGGQPVPGAIAIFALPGLPPVASAADASGIARLSIDYASTAQISIFGEVGAATATVSPGEYRPGVFATNVAHTTLDLP